MTIVLIAAAFAIGFAIGSGLIVREIHLLRSETLAAIREVKSAVQVAEFRFNASAEQIHKRLKAMGGTLSTDFKDAEQAVHAATERTKEA